MDLTDPEKAEPETPPHPEPSFSDLLGEFATEAGTLVRQELALAADEMAQKARYAGRNAILVGVGALLGAVALLVLAGALVLAVRGVLPMWASASLIGAVIGAAGYVAIRRGTSALLSIDLLPTETFASLKEDQAMAEEEIAATREQLATTIGEVRRQLQPIKRKKGRAPAKRRKA